jgi:mannitol 2-dehydrogenase
MPASALGYLAYLAGEHRTTSEAMTNPIIAYYLRAPMGEEITRLLPAVPGTDLDEYVDTLLQRFANPRISDQLARLCGRGSTKMPAYLLPSLVAARAEGRRAALLTLAVAGWCRYLRGYDLRGKPDRHRGRAPGRTAAAGCAAGPRPAAAVAGTDHLRAPRRRRGVRPGAPVGNP